MYRLEGKHKTKVLFGGVIALLVLFAGAAGFFFWQYTNLKDGKATAVDDKALSQDIIGKVDNLYKLPTGEEPSVAEVKDLSKLEGQEFFKEAKNGDYVLIYSVAKKAFLYRQSENRLINVAPVNLDAQQQGQAAGASTQAPQN